MKKSAWGSQLGFYLAAVGSAFGLGSLWRFPYIVSENGGGGFVLLYAAMVFVVGLPLLIAELIIGRNSRLGVIMALKSLRDDKALVDMDADKKPRLNKLLRAIIPTTSRAAIVICVLVLSYYSLICGWVLYFLMRFLVDFIVAQGLNAEASLEFLLQNGWLQVLLTSVHLLILTVIVARDVEEGTEKWVGNVMPMFLILLVVLMVKSMSLDSQEEALRFFLYPDFAKLSWHSLADAIGHVFFALSLGFGTMITFGSYLNEKTYIPVAGVRIATLDFMISMIAGILIFPLVFSITAEAGGAELLFETVPAFFSQLPQGDLFGIGFFLCLYLSALGASIGLFETVVANLGERYKARRSGAAWMTGASCLAFALFPAMTSQFHFSAFGGRSLLEILDLLLINWVLPVVVLVMCLVVSHRLSEKIKHDSFLSEKSHTSDRLYAHWVFSLRWLVPAIIVLALGLQIVGVVLA